MDGWINRGFVFVSFVAYCYYRALIAPKDIRVNHRFMNLNKSTVVSLLSIVFSTLLCNSDFDLFVRATLIRIKLVDSERYRPIRHDGLTATRT